MCIRPTLRGLIISYWRREFMAEHAEWVNDNVFRI